MNYQLGGIGLKPQDLVTPFQLICGESIPDFHMLALHSISKIYPLNDNTAQKNNLTSKYIMELSKLKHLQRYMNYFEMDYIKFERKPQIHQLYIDFEITM